YVDERDFEMIDILDDFKQYCLDEGLISDRDNWMRAITAGDSMSDSLKLNLYYDKASINYTSQGYIGLYANKIIHAIGKIRKTAIASYQNGVFKCEPEGDYKLTKDDTDRIKKAFEKFGDVSSLTMEPHRFFLVDKFYNTKFVKSSKNGIQKCKLFDLGQVFKDDKMPNTEQIANYLNGKTWEEFY
ncbi:MAG: hypothetical protein ACLRFE_03795, partial [Clostridia bacterium]